MQIATLHKENLEKAVISQAIADIQYAEWTVGHLDRQDFACNCYRHIYVALAGLVRDDAAVSVPSIAQQLADHDRLENVGGEDALRDIRWEGQYDSASGGGIQELEEYAQELRTYRQLRELQQRAACIQQDVEDGKDVDSCLAEAQQAVGEVEELGRLRGNVRRTESNSEELAEWLREERRRKPSVDGLRFGVKGVDKQTGGLDRQHLVLLKARTGYGKTTLAAQALWATYTQDGVGGDSRMMAFLLEGNVRELYRRWIAWRAEVSNDILGPGGLREADNERDENVRINRAMKEWKKLPLVVTDDVSDIAKIESTVRQQDLRTGVSAVIIDYAQLVQGGHGETTERRYADVGGRLQDLAKEVSAPILVPSQITPKQGRQSVSKGAKAWQEASSMVVWLTRGGGEKRQDAIQSLEAKLFCEKSRYEAPFSPVDIVFRGDRFRLYDRDVYDKQRRRQGGDPFEDY